MDPQPTVHVITPPSRKHYRLAGDIDQFMAEGHGGAICYLRTTYFQNM